MTKLKFEITDDPSEKDVDILRDGILSSLPESMEPSNRKPFAVFLRNDENEIVAGISGRTWWRWLDISCLWVREDLRDQDIGTKLIQQAEEIGRERQCTSALVDTLDVQARDFYEKLGYRVWGALDDFPEGHKRYYLSKKLE